MIRFIICCLIVGLYLLLMIPVLLIECRIRKVSPLRADISSLRMVQWAFRMVVKAAGVKLTIIGEEKIPSDTAVLYVANHRSMFDILITYARCKNRTGFVAKKEIEKFRPLSDWMRALHCLFLDRKDIKAGLKTILEAIEKIKEGISIFIFPEGTRCKAESDLDMLPFHDGSFKIATKTKCPIIPVAISNTNQIFEAHFPIVKPVKVVVEYCDPIYSDQLDKETLKHIGAYTQNIILETLKKNQELI